MRHLPPLNALRVFEVAARTASYAHAGLELGLTHGAVSRQIALLEGWLGHKLFAKDGRRMVATPTAKIFAAEVSLTFDRLSVAAEACGRPSARRILRVSAPTSLAMRWLIPRLDGYHKDHPHVEVIVSTVSCLVEELRGGVDLSIRRGVVRDDVWPHHHVVSILDEVDTLIMSPTLFERYPVHKPSDIEHHKLLASETRAGDWDNWMREAGVQHLSGLPRQTFDQFFVTRQAVEDGLGIAIGPLPMLDIDIAKGTLITPFPWIQVPRTGYVAVFPRRSDPGSLIGGFVDWMVAEGAKPNAPPSESDLSAHKQLLSA